MQIILREHCQKDGIWSETTEGNRQAAKSAWSLM